MGERGGMKHTTSPSDHLFTAYVGGSSASIGQVGFHLPERGACLHAKHVAMVGRGAFAAAHRPTRPLVTLVLLPRDGCLVVPVHGAFWQGPGR